MPRELTSVQIEPTTRDRLRMAKAQAAAKAGRSMDYDDMVEALLDHWEQHPPMGEPTPVEAGAAR